MKLFSLATCASIVLGLVSAENVRQASSPMAKSVPRKATAQKVSVDAANPKPVPEPPHRHYSNAYKYPQQEIQGQQEQYTRKSTNFQKTPPAPQEASGQADKKEMKSWRQLSQELMGNVNMDELLNSPEMKAAADALKPALNTATLATDGTKPKLDEHGIRKFSQEILKNIDLDKVLNSDMMKNFKPEDLDKAASKLDDLLTGAKQPAESKVEETGENVEQKGGKNVDDLLNSLWPNSKDKNGNKAPLADFLADPKMSEQMNKIMGDLGKKRKGEGALFDDSWLDSILGKHKMDSRKDKTGHENNQRRKNKPYGKFTREIEDMTDLDDTDDWMTESSSDRHLTL